MIVPEYAGPVYPSGTPLLGCSYTTQITPNFSHRSTNYSAGYGAGWPHTVDGNLPHTSCASGNSTEDALLDNYLDPSFLEAFGKLASLNNPTLSMTPESAQGDVLSAAPVNKYMPRASSEVPTQTNAFPSYDDTRYHTPSLHGTPVFAEPIKPLPTYRDDPSLFISPTQLVGPVESRETYEIQVSDPPRLSRSPRARRRTTRSSRSSRSASSGSDSAPASTGSSSPEPAPATPDFISCKRRNLQVSPAQVPPPQYAAYRTNRWKCPHCSYVQTNRRSPDLKRHIATHLRANTPAWVCCGVPYVNAIEHGMPEDVLRSEQLFEFEGMLMVGGCKKTFSRRDALGRHLRSQDGVCYGDALALWLPGNREGSGAH